MYVVTELPALVWQRPPDSWKAGGNLGAGWRDGQAPNADAAQPPGCPQPCETLSRGPSKGVPRLGISNVLFLAVAPVVTGSNRQAT